MTRCNSGYQKNERVKKYDGTYFYGDLYSKTMVIFQGLYLKHTIILEVISFGKMMWKKS